jgi:hypothetical protein
LLKEITTKLFSKTKIKRTPEFTIETKKVGAGQFQVTVTDSANDEIKLC